MWIRVFPQKSFTKKPLETRMGKGKGPLEGWVAVIRPANVLFEVDGVTEVEARESLRLAATKLPIKTKFISRHRFALGGIEVMKFSEIKDMTLVELAAKSRDLRHEMFNLRLQQASAQLEKPARLRTLRKDIARLETRISQLAARTGLQTKRLNVWLKQQSNGKRRADIANSASAKSSPTRWPRPSWCASNAVSRIRGSGRS